MVSVEEAVRETIDTDEGPVVLGDLADSGGAGTPGDGTAILAELLKQKPNARLLAVIADPVAVQLAVQAGVGKRVNVTAGGKVDKFHGDPVEIAGRVRAIHDGVFSASTRFNAGTFHRGPTAVVDCGGTEVILTSRPVLQLQNYARRLVVRFLG
jgi:microcystin degradation protein MlrC